MELLITKSAKKSASAKEKIKRLIYHDIQWSDRLILLLGYRGVGKTTLMTKITNHAFNLGYNVLQLFFEDNPKIIQRKQYMFQKIIIIFTAQRKIKTI